MKKWFGIVLSIIMATGLLSACGNGDIEDQVANVVQSEDIHILGVKGGTPFDYPGKTYGEAFENFFASPTWKYFVGTKEGADEDGNGEPDYTEENVEIVEFTGRCTYQDVEVKALIQFTLNKEDDTFEATYLSFNEVPQSMFMLGALLEAVFTDGEMDTFIATPILGDFVNVTDYSGSWGDGWTYEISWDSVDGAEGYEVEYTETESSNEGEGYHDATEVVETVFSVSGSVEVEVTIRVRAYAEENGERVYSEWSEPRSAVLDYDDSEGALDDFIGHWIDAALICDMDIGYEDSVYQININEYYMGEASNQWWLEGYMEQDSCIHCSGTYVELYTREDGTVGSDLSESEGILYFNEEGFLCWDDLNGGFICFSPGADSGYGQ